MSQYCSGKIVLTGLLIILPVIAVTTFATKTKDAPKLATDKQTLSVKAIRPQDANFIVETLEFPAIVKAENEVEIVTKASGTATRVNFNLGDKVTAGKVLATIDDAGSSLETNESGFKNIQIQQAELAMKQAKKSLDLTRDNYKDRDGLSSSQKNALKAQRDIAELQYQAAELNLQSLKDIHNIKAPSSGTVTRKNISAGETVSAGQVIAIVSHSENINLTFYVSEQELQHMKADIELSVKNNDGTIKRATISHVGTSADETTRRYPVEVRLKKDEGAGLNPGSIISIIIQIKKSPSREGGVILNLSSINIGQNGNSIFVVRNRKAVRIPIALNKIEGEYAEINADFESEDKIIISGNKLVSDGETVIIE